MALRRRCGINMAEENRDWLACQRQASLMLAALPHLPVISLVAAAAGGASGSGKTGESDEGGGRRSGRRAVTRAAVRWREKMGVILAQRIAAPPRREEEPRHRNGIFAYRAA
jgi:hypothetical protein